MFLNVLFYSALVGLVLVVAAGLVNLCIRSSGQGSRSNMLMRARVAVQVVLIALLVVAGLTAGVI